MNGLLEFFQENYFTSLGIIVLGVAGVKIGLQQRKNIPLLKFLPAYFIISVIQSLFNCLNFFKWERAELEALYAANNYIILLFIICEAIIFGHLFIHILKNKLIKQSLKIFTAIFPAVVVLLSFYIPTAHELFTIAYIAEAALLAIPSAWYFYELVKTPPELNPAIDPRFWVVTGLSFLLIVTLPYIVIQDYIAETDTRLFDKLQTLVYFAYCLFFSFIIKGYMCISKNPTVLTSTTK